MPRLRRLLSWWEDIMVLECRLFGCVHQSSISHYERFQRSTTHLDPIIDYSNYRSIDQPQLQNPCNIHKNIYKWPNFQFQTSRGSDRSSSSTRTRRNGSRSPPHHHQHQTPSQSTPPRATAPHVATAPSTTSRVPNTRRPCSSSGCPVQLPAVRPCRRLRKASLSPLVTGC
ncbi:hypothetical protein EJ03DRAFT_193571 [Teratosphaeria nubilosa]|uniref:Uncharacterized protein n=1 Tax=Teratosphaeria nubilosa TaxID=161662 RepID=A0A6G1L003_9PEZI|nr:hypothetical protein EJ03DRAFT_193571 [Teratosphaeria nubilosa]